MTCRAWTAFGAAAALLLGGCDKPPVDSSADVAAELRALRLTLQSTPRPVVDPGQVTTALSPLRETLTALVREQGELRERQLQLTQELQRWATTAPAATAAPKGEVEALAARLQQLEAALQAQAARHREVEAMLGDALDKTSERLDDFLRRLGSPPTPKLPDKPGEGGASPAPVPGTPDRPDAATPPGERRAGAAVWPTRHDGGAWWWGAVLAGSGLLAAGSAWQLRRSASPPTPATTLASLPPTFDAGVAALLSAGDDLAAPPPADPADADLATEGAVDPAEAAAFVDDVFVIEDDLPGPGSPGSSDSPPADHTLADDRDRPCEVLCRVSAGDPALAMGRVLQVLAQDPRVLRRPAPRVTLLGDGVVEVRFAVWAALPLGERADVRHRVRAAIA